MVVIPSTSVSAAVAFGVPCLIRQEIQLAYVIVCAESYAVPKFAYCGITLLILKQ